MNVIDRIQHLLTERGVKPRSIKPTLAKVCGISYEAVRQWFAGDTSNIRNENLMAIAEEYGVSVDWLLGGTKQQLLEIDQGATRAVAMQSGTSESAAPSYQVALGRALFNKATPRSQGILDRIMALEAQGSLTDEDLQILEKIIERFGSKQ